MASPKLTPRLHGVDHTAHPTRKLRETVEAEPDQGVRVKFG